MGLYNRYVRHIALSSLFVAVVDVGDVDTTNTPRPPEVGAKVSDAATAMRTATGCVVIDDFTRKRHGRLRRRRIAGWSKGEHRCCRKGLAFGYLLMMGSLIINYRRHRGQIALSCSASSRKIDRRRRPPVR